MSRGKHVNKPRWEEKKKKSWQKIRKLQQTSYKMSKFKCPHTIKPARYDVGLVMWSLLIWNETPGRTHRCETAVRKGNQRTLWPKPWCQYRANGCCLRCKIYIRRENKDVMLIWIDLEALRRRAKQTGPPRLNRDVFLFPPTVNSPVLSALGETNF